ncbi:interferon-related developmental regulator 1-like isoform X1 [Haliotis rufescens]|uniref:interferon-related developmental regulator 1-like isoform X1 n=1 Tax=Haliotis rufescens TaxID=6454 RepID=UPI001EB08B62|nr:interferon-related developmental regulator 1-like isoform X1 [Haliotis rufescens]
MPKNKKKRGLKVADKSRQGSRPPTDDECDTGDNWSTASVLSEDANSLPDSGGDVETEDSNTQEDFEDKLKECIEGTLSKSAVTRKNCLEGIQKSFSKKYILEFLADRKVTVADCLTKCLRKGKGDEQALAASCIALLITQLGEEAEALFVELRPFMLTVMADKSASVKARGKCANALAICNFLAGEDLEHVRTVMTALEDVFRASYVKGDNSSPSHSPEVCAMHSKALSGWCLLLSIAPSFLVEEMVSSHLDRMTGLLRSSDVDLRITAGEAIALMYELSREGDEDFEGPKMLELCELLKQLATDSNKFRAKKDRRQQRSSFRDILRTIEEWDAPDMSIKFGVEGLHLDTWVRKKQYDTFCDLLGSGIYQHLQENTLIREIFGLGAPRPIGAKPPQKLTKFERNMYNAAAFKARTKLRQKHRDKRSVSVNGV